MDAYNKLSKLQYGIIISSWMRRVHVPVLRFSFKRYRNLIVNEKEKQNYLCPIYPPKRTAQRDLDEDSAVGNTLRSA